MQAVIERVGFACTICPKRVAEFENRGDLVDHFELRHPHDPIEGNWRYADIKIHQDTGLNFPKISSVPILA